MPARHVALITRSLRGRRAGDGPRLRAADGFGVALLAPGAKRA